MSRYLGRSVSRRHLLSSVAGIAAGAALYGRGSRVQARRHPATEVLTHDEVQEAAAFGRGKHLGTSVRGGALDGNGTFESEVIAAPFRFTHVGLHWRANLDQLDVELRTSADGLLWSDWQGLHIEAPAGQTPAGDTFASLVAAPRYQFMQYRTTLSRGQSANQITATFLNVDDGPTLSAATTAAVSKPSFIDFTREEWGCNEALRFDRRGREIWPRMYVPVKKLIIHHTAGRNDYTSDEAIGEVKAVYTYHAKTQGWGDVGYHVIVDRFGRSYEGRYSRDWSGGREVAGADVVGGHAFSHNYGSFGVAVLGEYEPGYSVGSDTLSNEEPPEAMLGRLIDVLAHRAAERVIDPLGVSHFLESDGTWNDLLPNISGHLDTSATACPGDLLYERLDDIRSSVSARLGQRGSPIFSSGPDGGPSSPTYSGSSLAYGWGPDGEVSAGMSLEYRYYLEGWSKTSTSEAVTYLTGFTSDRRPDWSDWVTATAASFSGLASGHYTMHVQQRMDEVETFVSNRTVMLSAPSGGKKPPRR